jgi:hypothetical protein
MMVYIHGAYGVHTVYNINGVHMYTCIVHTKARLRYGIELPSPSRQHSVSGILLHF